MYSKQKASFFTYKFTQSFFCFSPLSFVIFLNKTLPVLNKNALCLIMTKYGNVSINTPKPIQGLCFVILGLFMLLALIDYQPLQSNFYQLSSETFPTSGNRLGYLGTYFSFYLCRYLGGTTWLLPVYALWTGILFLLGRQHKINKKQAFLHINSHNPSFVFPLCRLSFF